MWIRVLIPVLLCLACALTPAEKKSDEATDEPATRTPAASPNGKIQFFLIIPDDNGLNGTPVGCGDSLVAIETQESLSGTLEQDIKTALDSLFALKTDSYGQSGFVTALATVNLMVQNVTVTGETAILNLGGSFTLTGVCDDARMQAQILSTLFQFPQLNAVSIYLNDDNMKQLFDMSGQVLTDVPYTREDLP